jgi:hypothetical protein
VESLCVGSTERPKTAQMVARLFNNQPQSISALRGVARVRARGRRSNVRLHLHRLMVHHVVAPKGQADMLYQRQPKSAILLQIRE